MIEKQYSIKYDPTYSVVTANDLIKGKQKMTLREAQLLFIAISQVIYEDKDFKTYTTTVPELARFMGIDENSLYRDLEGICTSLCKQVVKIQVGGENAKGRKKWKVFSWVQSAEYDGGNLTIRLSDDIKPYLLDLEAYYSQTLLGTLMTFRSYYAIRLYQYVKAEFDASKRNKETWNFTVEEIRDLFQIKESQYKLTRDLIRNTIKPALEEIGASQYAYVWDYEEHRANKRGRPLESVSFKAFFFDDTGKGMTKEWFIKECKPTLDKFYEDQADQSED